MSMKSVGILGGGQLGRMLAQACQPMGIHTSVLDPMGDEAPAASVANDIHKGHFNNADDVFQFYQKSKCDVLTVEIEHVNVDALQKIQDKGANIQPSPNTIRLIQDKYLQKCHLRKFDVELPEFKSVNNETEILDAGKLFGYPMMLKSRKLAYDGRGNAVISSPNDISKALKSLVSSDEVYVEKWVTFVKELAVIVVRGLDGSIVSYETVETIQKDSMCNTVIAPAQIDHESSIKARIVAEKAIASFDGAGVFGVELFLLPNGDVLLNEIAPRVHNSGHFTIEACETSQFEQHIRAICGLPLGSSRMRVSAAIMINVIGDGNMDSTFSMCSKALTVPGASVHWYGKKEAKVKRKMGHITVVGHNMFEAFQRASVISDLEIQMGPSPVVGVIMGSDSDLPIMKAAAEILRDFQVPFELTIVSAHRTPQRMFEYASSAHKRGIKIIIAGAGGAAHLPGMVAAITPLPVIGVPVALKYLDGQDSLYSIVQMPRGVPVATVAINNATNAGLLAVRMLGGPYLEKMMHYQKGMEEGVHKKVEVLATQGWEKYKPEA